MFAPYLKGKLYSIIRNEEDILVRCIKVLLTTARLEIEDFDIYCRYAGARDYDIDNNGNSGINGNDGNNSDAVAFGPSSNEGACGPAGGREWTNRVGVSHTLSYKSQDKNAAKP